MCVCVRERERERERDVSLYLVWQARALSSSNDLRQMYTAHTWTVGAYRGTSLIRNSGRVGPYGRTMPRTL